MNLIMMVLQARRNTRGRGSKVNIDHMHPWKSNPRSSSTKLGTWRNLHIHCNKERKTH
jgi:hypothetical protein